MTMTTPDALREALEELCLSAECAAGVDEGAPHDVASSEIMSAMGSAMAVSYDRARAALATNPPKATCTHPVGDRAEQAREGDMLPNLWALCYLHDWDEPREDGSQPIYPEVHRVYETEHEAFKARAHMAHPHKYWVRRAHQGIFCNGKDDFRRAALSQATVPTEQVREAVQQLIEDHVYRPGGIDLSIKVDRLALADAILATIPLAKGAEPLDEAKACIEAQERLLKSVLAAIDTGRSEPLFIVRDLLRNFLEDARPLPEPPSSIEGGK